jgi:hypothetical protein
LALSCVPVTLTHRLEMSKVKISVAVVTKVTKFVRFCRISVKTDRFGLVRIFKIG